MAEFTKIGIEKLIRRTFTLAKRAEGKTSPNPIVGAVLVKNGKIVGEGYHHKAGQPHAEIEALKHAGTKAKGCTLFTNLEPCCHHGRTPPCTDAVIKAGITKVYSAMKDPNPLVNGKGFLALENAGIRAESGYLESEARYLNRIYVKYATSTIPYVIVKWAASLDGKIATGTGESRWITGEQSRKYAHKIRSKTDAILVGRGTVLADDPQLTVRYGYKRTLPLYRVIMDENLEIPGNSKVLQRAEGYPTVIAADKTVVSQHNYGFGDHVEILGCNVNEDGVDPQHLLELLGQKQITSLLVEGGPGIIASFIKSQLVDELVVFVAARIISGQDAISAVASIGCRELDKTPRYKIHRMMRLGNDIMLELFPERLN